MDIATTVRQRLQGQDVLMDSPVTPNEVRVSTYVDELGTEGWLITLVLDTGQDEAWQYGPLTEAKRDVAIAVDKFVSSTPGMSLPGLTLVTVAAAEPDDDDEDEEDDEDASEGASGREDQCFESA